MLLSSSMYGKSLVQSLYATPESLSANTLKQNFVGDGVIVKFLDEMRGQAYGAVVQFVVVLWMVEDGHGIVFHLLWPSKKWVHLGCGHGHCSASTSNPLVQLRHMSLQGGWTGKGILSYRVHVQVQGTIEESSIDCLAEGCNGRVA